MVAGNLLSSSGKHVTHLAISSTTSRIFKSNMLYRYWLYSLYIMKMYSLVMLLNCFVAWVGLGWLLCLCLCVHMHWDQVKGLGALSYHALPCSFEADSLLKQELPFIFWGPRLAAIKPQWSSCFHHLSARVHEIHVVFCIDARIWTPAHMPGQYTLTALLKAVTEVWRAVYTIFT